MRSSNSASMELRATYATQTASGDTDLLVKTPQLGADLAQSLGDKRVALMRGHGPSGQDADTTIAGAVALPEIIGNRRFMAFG